jgi:hypothetical protein
VYRDVFPCVVEYVNASKMDVGSGSATQRGRSTTLIIETNGLVPLTT